MPTDDCIKRSDALKAILGVSIYDTIEELEGARTIAENTWADGLYDAYKIIEEEVDAADVEPVVRCRDCKYKPFVKPEYKDKKYPYPFIEPGGAEIEFPDEENNPCPFLDGDPYGNIMPKDDFFCAHGARKGGEKDNA